MVARGCQYCHEDHCIVKIELGESFECKGMLNKNGLIECTATDDDLVDGCEDCGCRPADADFPYNEYCKECAEIRRTEDKFESK